MSVNRNRIHYFFLIIGVIGIGLMSRSSFIPDLIYPYLGDVIYALMVYLIIGFLFPTHGSMTVGIAAFGACFLIELSQLYKGEWIEEIRNTKLGGLVLGYGFLWSDVLSYIVGTFIGYGLERIFNKKFTSETQ